VKSQVQIDPLVVVVELRERENVGSGVKGILETGTGLDGGKVSVSVWPRPWSRIPAAA
jgi:hypothetical protein